MKILLGVFLILSLALNVLLWTQLSSQSTALKAALAAAGELEELRRENQELEAKRTSASDTGGADARELAQLRNEVGPLRTQAAEASAWRAQAADAVLLRARLAAATQTLARAESELAEAAKLTTEQLQQLKDEAQSTSCVNNLKQIGLAARIWANDHKDVFPPDFLSMKDELATPKVLFCPADTTAVRVTDWSQLNPSAISYRFLNANGNETDPSKVLTQCPIHGHVGLSDGSVQRKQ